MKQMESNAEQLACEEWKEKEKNVGEHLKKKKTKNSSKFERMKRRCMQTTNQVIHFVGKGCHGIVCIRIMELRFDNLKELGKRREKITANSVSLKSPMFGKESGNYEWK